MIIVQIRDAHTYTVRVTGKAWTELFSGDIGARSYDRLRIALAQGLGVDPDDVDLDDRVPMTEDEDDFDDELSNDGKPEGLR